MKLDFQNVKVEYNLPGKIYYKKVNIVYWYQQYFLNKISIYTIQPINTIMLQANYIREKIEAM